MSSHKSNRNTEELIQKLEQETDKYLEALVEIQDLNMQLEDMYQQCRYKKLLIDQLCQEFIQLLKESNV